MSVKATKPSASDADDDIVILDKPPAAALSKQQTKAKQDTSLSSPSEDPALLEYLRELLNAPPEAWKKANTMADVLNRYLAVQNAIETLQGFNWNSRTMGGFKVPDGECFISVGISSLTTI